MGISYGQYTYSYEVEIDFEDIVDRIAQKIGHMDDGYCWDLDGSKIIISARHTTGYKHWYYKATLESPEEDEIMPYHRVDDEVDIEKAVLDALHDTDTVKVNLTVDEDYDYGDE